MAAAAPSSASTSTSTDSMMETEDDTTTMSTINPEKQQQQQQQPQKQEQDEEEEEGPTLLPEHQNVTILALRMSSRKRLGMFLNIDSIPSAAGQLPNYQGLAELVGFEFIEQQSFEREKDPTMALLLEWGNRPELSPTLGSLVEYLSKLERLDVLEDCRTMIRNDAEHYLKKKAAGSSEIKPVQDSTVSQSPFNIDDMKVDETAIMTIQDVEAGKPTYYDAFVCYHPEGEDLKFVKEMIAKVESPPYNMRLFVPHRDDLPGSSKYTISAKLIQDRCKRMIIVMSPRYLQSDACDFQTKFAHALSPGSRSKKLVPVLIQYCATPNILRHVCTCDYTRPDMNLWFWERLTKSLQAPLNPADIQVNTGTDLNALQLNIRGPESASLALPPAHHPPTKGAVPEKESNLVASAATASSNPYPPSSSSSSMLCSPVKSSGSRGGVLRVGGGGVRSPTKTALMDCGDGASGGGGGVSYAFSPTTTTSSTTAIQETSSGNNSPTNSLTKTKKKKKGSSQGALSPLSSSPSSSSPTSPTSPHTPPTPGSPSSRKGSDGVEQQQQQPKKKSLKSKLTAVFSSSH